MTLPSSGPISVSQILSETGRPGYSASLSFLNNLITPGQRPGTPHLQGFYGLTYFQNNNQGNCNNGNCSPSGGPNGNCTNNCNCGNIQCTNCVIAGPSDCSNCANCSTNVNCANCDGQAWLQSNCNCACTYNCNCGGAVSYNCNTGLVSYNCNCACNCSKIVCAKFYDMGMMSQEVWSADQAYGRVLRKKDKTIYRGYIKWAKICTQWMDGHGPDFMPWILDKEERKLKQKEFATDILYRVGQPWSEHMAYIMGTLNKDNDYGRILMSIGRPLCKFFGSIPRVPRKYRKHGFFTSWTILSLLYFSYYTGKAILNVKNLFGRVKSKLLKEA